jgi:dolichol-phosphate mannosyltransferase
VEPTVKLDVFVTIVVPLRNDADILEAVIADVYAIMRQNFGEFELIFVDDGSTDETLSIFLDASRRLECLRYYRLARTFGIEAAIACGLEQAIGDVVVVLNPARDPPELIPQFVADAQANSGIVIGVENRGKSRNALYRLAYDLHYAASKVLLERPQIYGATHYVALTRTALNALLKIKDSFRYVRVLAMYAGFKVTKLPYEPRDRRSPARRSRALPLIEGSVSMIVSNSSRPLRIAGAISALASLLNFSYLGYVIGVRYLWQGVQPGWASTAFQNATMFCLLFLVLAVVCEYLARLIAEVKHRPVYVVEDEFQSRVMLALSEIRNVVLDEQKPKTIATESSDRELVAK